jgi:hypothetical protein
LTKLDVAVFDRTVDHELITIVEVRGKQKVIWTRPVPTHRSRLERPDGGVPANRLDDPQTLEEAEAYAAAQMATAEASQSELEASNNDIQSWIDANGGGACKQDEPHQSPDGGHPAASMPPPDCVTLAVEALTTAVSAVWAIDDYKAAISSGILSLRALIGGYQAAFEAGAIGLTALENMVGGACIDFVLGLNVGWLVAGVMIASAGYFAYEWLTCAYILDAPEPPPNALKPEPVW